MERKIRAGDIVVVNVNNRHYSLIIFGITAFQINAGEYTIIPRDGAWQVANYNIPHTVSFYAQNSLKIITLNLGYNVIANIVAGSESSLVEMCQTAYGGGWKDSSRTISTCTYNSAELLSHYTLFGLQEVHPKYRTKLQETIQGFNPSANYKFISGAGILTGFDQNVTGEGVLLTPSTYLLKDRGMQIISFPKLGLIFINLHAPHNINLKKEIEKNCSQIKLSSAPKRVIMVGDFNDFKGSLLTKSIDVFGFHLRIPNATHLLTCCADSEYVYPGDYILTSNYKGEHYGYPPKYVRGRPLISDHDPVVLQ